MSRDHLRGVAVDLRLHPSQEALLATFGFPWVRSGEVYEQKRSDGRVDRVVVYYASALFADRQRVRYAPLPSSTPHGGGAYVGPDSHERFRRDWGFPVGRMRFEGAYKLYQRELAAHQRTRYAYEVRQARAAMRYINERYGKMAAWGSWKLPPEPARPSPSPLPSRRSLRRLARAVFRA